ncbi:uncharacterized protein LOC135497628 [Lineus longissimus]|uniref:uncharacterized protein LOC135497628 n=1 Tax=Lineus longissimus TaxID=88925 RepID=UPI002B4DB90F
MIPENLLRIVLSLLIGALLAQSSQDCDGENQASFQGYCYSFFVNDTEHAASLAEAKTICNQLNGSSLVSVESAEEQRFLEQAVTSRKGDKQTWRFWTSGEGKLDRWKWINDNKPLGLQGCLTYRKGMSPKRRCSITHTFVSPEDCQERCRQNRNCYFSISTAAVYKNNDAIMCVCFDDKFWGNAKYSDTCTFPCPGDNSTTCGGNKAYHIYNINGTYTAWSTTADSSILARTCAKMDRDAGYLWAKADCNDKIGYICQNDIQNGEICPASFIEVGGSCVQVNTEPTTWFNARMACNRQAATLVSIRHDEMQMGLVEKLLSGNGNGSSSFWIGATSFTWKWGNGNDIIYTDWLGDMPVLSDRNVFVTMVYDPSKNESNTLGWRTLPNLKDSLFKDGYVCEKEVPKITTTTTTHVLVTTSSHTGKPPISDATTSSPNDTPIDPGFQTGDKSGGTIPGAAIGAIIVIAIIIIIAIVVATIIIKRRKQGTELTTPNGSVSTGFGNPATDPSINPGDSRAVPDDYEVPSSILRNQPVDDVVTYRKQDDKVETPTLQRSSFENPCYRSYDDILDATGNDVYELEMPEVDIDGDLALYDNNQPDGNVYDNNNR